MHLPPTGIDCCSWSGDSQSTDREYDFDRRAAQILIVQYPTVRQYQVVLDDTEAQTMHPLGWHPGDRAGREGQG